MNGDGMLNCSKYMGLMFLKDLLVGCEVQDWMCKEGILKGEGDGWEVFGVDGKWYLID